MAKLYVGRWDCEQCGQKMIKGPETKCPNCGASRPKNVEFYLPNENDVILDPEKIRQAKSGADWVCSFCEGHNKAWNQVCQSCGNDREEKDGDKFLEEKEYDNNNVPIQGKKIYRQLQNERFRASQDWKNGEIVSDVYINPVFKKLLPVLGVLAVVIAIIAFIGSRRTDIQVTVERFEWNRTINVQEYKEVTEEDWTIPNGGKELSSFRAIHHYDKVSDGFVTRTRTVREAVGSEDYVCGKRSLGNGVFEDKICSKTIYEERQETYEEEVFRKEPVYKTKYKYTIFKWVNAPPIKTSDANKNPEWGDISAITANENLRENGRQETYTIVVRDEKNETHRHELNRSRWDQLSIGEFLKAQRNGFGSYKGLAE